MGVPPPPPPPTHHRDSGITWRDRIALHSLTKRDKIALDRVTKSFIAWVDAVNFRDPFECFSSGIPVVRQEEEEEEEGWKWKREDRLVNSTPFIIFVKDENMFIL